MRKNLFRKEALDSRKEQLWGEILLIQPLSYKILSFVIISFVVSVFVLLVNGDYARKETVRGYIVPDKGMVKVYPPHPGSIAEIFVAEGQSIQSGTVLAKIYTGKGNSLGIEVSDLLQKSLSQQKASVTEKISQETKLLKSEQQRLQQLLTGLDKELAALLKRKNRLGIRIELSEEELNTMQKLSKQGFASSKEYKAKRDQHLALLSDKDLVEQNHLSLQNRKRDSESSLNQLPINTAKIMADLYNQQAQLDQQLLQIEGQSVYTIKSAVAGRVTSLQIVPGQSVTSSMPIIAILPEGALLQAELFIPSRAIGFVDQSESVLIRYDAFPYQRFGLYQGKIINVAEAIFRPEELPVPVALKEPVYRVKVQLNKQNVNAYGKQFHLQSGMLLEADVILETRSLFEWLLEPIYSLSGKL